MRKRKWVLAAVCVGAGLLLVLCYVGLALYYREGFALNTWINGVYCTGSTVQQVNARLLEQTEAPESITVIGYDKTESGCTERQYTISLQELNCSLDYETNLNTYLAEQNPWLWVENLTLHREHTVSPAINYDEDALKKQWEQIAAGVRAEEEYRIDYSPDEGYSLYDGLHNRLDEDKAYEILANAVLTGADSVNLIAEGCYYDDSLSREQQELAAIWNRIQCFQENGPVYDFGDGEEQIEPGQMAAFLQKNLMNDADEETAVSNLPQTDANGYFVLDESAVADWIGSMAALHDTYGREWEFQSTRGDIVTVKGVTYGTTMDQKREIQWLTEYLQQLLRKTEYASSLDMDESQEVRIPAYTREAYNRSSTGIGDTYIEVDMGIQKLYYYESGELKLETDIVTGNARRKMSTPEGVNYVYNKQRNRILRGEGYASPVSYWMPVKGAIGIHDASWRNKFGGDIYKSNGSHGCINVASDVMSQLYEMVEVGTPVVMFYGEESENTADSLQTK